MSARGDNCWGRGAGDIGRADHAGGDAKGTQHSQADGPRGIRAEGSKGFKVSKGVRERGTVVGGDDGGDSPRKAALGANTGLARRKGRQVGIRQGSGAGGGVVE